MSRDTVFAERFIDILSANNIISEKQVPELKKAFSHYAKPSFVDFLLEGGFVSRPALLNCLSEYYGLPAFDVVGQFFRRELVTKFPKDIMITHQFIPLRLDENILMVVASEPDNEELLEKIGDYVSYHIIFVAGIAHNIIDAVEEFYDPSIVEQEMEESGNSLHGYQVLDEEDEGDDSE